MSTEGIKERVRRACSEDYFHFAENVVIHRRPIGDQLEIDGELFPFHTPLGCSVEVTQDVGDRDLGTIRVTIPVGTSITIHEESE